MGKGRRGGYLGGSTIIGRNGYGFSPLLEGGRKKGGQSIFTPNQIKQKEQSEATAERLGIDQRTKKQKRKDARVRKAAAKAKQKK